MDDYEYDRIVSSDVYITLSKENNQLSDSNTRRSWIIFILLVFISAGLFRLFSLVNECKAMEQQLENAYDLITDAETSYYSGYIDGQSVYFDTYNKDIAEAKRTSYTEGYSSAMIDMESSNDYAEAYIDGYEDGWSIGYDDGYRIGNDDGFEIGKESGYDDGYQEGHSDGYYEGYHDAD